MTLPVIATPKPSKLSREATLACNARNWHAVSHVARLFSTSVALGRRGGNGRFPTSRGRPEGEPPVVEGGFAFGERATRDSHARGCGSRAASHDARVTAERNARARANSSSSVNQSSPRKKSHETRKCVRGACMWPRRRRRRRRPVSSATLAADPTPERSLPFLSPETAPGTALIVRHVSAQLGFLKGPS